MAAKRQVKASRDGKHYPFVKEKKQQRFIKSKASNRGNGIGFSLMNP
jgi:hypothetical protein